MWFPECPLFGGKNTLRKRFGTKDSVRCSEFGGSRFSEVANVLQVWDFQSVTRALSALGSTSASRSVRSGYGQCGWQKKEDAYRTVGHFLCTLFVHSLHVGIVVPVLF